MMRSLTVLVLVACAPAADAATPALSASLNSSASPTIFGGWPLLLYVEIRNDGADALTLAPADEPWPSAFAVRLVGAGAPSPLPFAPTLPSPSPALTLPVGSMTNLVLALPGAATAQLAAGNYSVDVSYAVTDGAGWRGNVHTSVHLTIADGVPSTPGQKLEGALLVAMAAGLAERNDDARKALNEYLADDPQSIPALTAMAELLERANDVEAAYFYATAALRVYADMKPEPGAEPPLRLISLHRRLWQQVLAKAPATTKAAAASAPAQPSTTAHAEPNATVSVRQATSAPPATSAAPMTAATKPAGVQVPLADLDDSKIVKDPKGQWANDAVASSQYRERDYAAKQATGAPDVARYADDPHAWAPSASERQQEWLEVAFAKPVIATELRIRQSFTPGTIVRIELIADDGRTLPVWSGRDASAYPPGRIAWFAVRFPATAVPIGKARIVLDTPALKGWKEIDAVQLVEP